MRVIILNKKFIILASILFLLVASVGLVGANPKDFELETWCDNLADDEIIVKFKSQKSSLELQKELSKAPKYRKQIQDFNQTNDLAQIKKKFKNISFIQTERAFDDIDEEDGEFETDDKVFARKQKLLKTRARLNLDRIYSLRLSINKSPYYHFLPQDQKKLYSCRELRRLIYELNLDPNIEYAEANHKLRFQAEVTDLFYAQGFPSWPYNYDTQWGLKKIGADKVWDKSQGQNVIVAVIDSGVDYTHPELVKNIWHHSRKKNIVGYNLAAKKKKDKKDPMDAIGHGTHIAGIIAASMDNQGMVGVAPRATILPLKVVDDRGYSDERAVAKAILKAAKLGADIANISMGASYETKLIYDAVQAVKNEMLIVAAAGNYNRDLNGYDKRANFYPATYDDVISVAAITETNQKAYFSNYGRGVDIAAPGGADTKGDKNILSTDLTDSKYHRRVGTSMAAPYVAGVAALLLAKNPNMSVSLVRKIILSSAKKLDSEIDLGVGLVDAYAAMNTRTISQY